MNQFASKSSPQSGRFAGFSLVEIMISLAIGSILVTGAVFVYSQTRTTYAVNESVARLQENARYAFSIIEPDVQLAGMYGYTNNPSGVMLRSGGVERSVTQTRQVDPAMPGLSALIQRCGRNFAVDLQATIQGSDNSFVLGPAAAAPGVGSGCATMIPSPNTDTVTIRRATAFDPGNPTALQANRLQLQAARLQNDNQRMFVNGVAPFAVVPGFSDIRNVIIRTYYIATNSDDQANFPALRVIALDAGQSFTDQELIPGVEDLQVQFGVDWGDYNSDGIIDVDKDNNGISDSANGRATAYVNSNDTILRQPPGLGGVAGGASAQVATVRIWIRLRTEQPEIGYQDNNTYTYANVIYTPAGAERSFRRILVSRTIFLRNSRTL
jgi:type IV pilus assembly protein PilW